MMRSNHHARIKSLQLVERFNPSVLLRLRGRLRHPEVYVVVHDIARDGHVERGDMQEGRVVRVRVSDVDGFESKPFEDEFVVHERFDGDGGVEGGGVDLVGEDGVPEGLLGDLGLHVVDGMLSGDDLDAGEAGREVGDVEPVVAVAVGDLDGAQGLVAEGFIKPVADGYALVVREERVNQYSGGLARDQGENGGLPHSERAIG